MDGSAGEGGGQVRCLPEQLHPDQFLETFWSDALSRFNAFAERNADS